MKAYREILPGLVAPAVFWALFFLVWYRAGSLPVVADSSDFPYRLQDLSLGDILVYFEREPPLFLLYVKKLSLFFDPVFPALALGNLLMMTAMLFMACSFLSRYLERAFAVSVCVFAAVGLEFFLYAICTRDEMLTAFWLFLLLQAHMAFFAPRAGGRARRIAAALAIPAVAVAVVMTQPSYSPFLLLYLLFLAGSGFCKLLKTDLAGSGLLAWYGYCAVVLCIPALLMLKNQMVFDHFSLGSRGYEGLQRSVFNELRERYVFGGERAFGRLLYESAILDDRAREFYAAGAPWPTTRDEVRQMLYGDSEYARLLRGWYPRRSYRSELYSHPASGNGYLFGPGLRLGHEAAQAILLQRPLEMIAGMAGRAAPLASCYSSHWFFPAYGRRLCAADQGFLTVLLKPDRILDPRRMAALQHQQSAEDFVRNLKVFLAILPGPVTGLHLLLQRYLIWPLLAFALLHLLGGGYALLGRREIDHGGLLLAAVIACSFLTAVFSDYGENMRWGIYYKLPLFCYVGWLLSRAGLGLRS